MLSFSEGRRWTATGVLTNRRAPDEGSLPRLFPNKGDVRLLVRGTARGRAAQGIRQPTDARALPASSFEEKGSWKKGTWEEKGT